MVAVCAHCRAPLGPGSHVTIYHPANYRRFSVAVGSRVYEDEDPIVVCRACSAYVDATLAQLKPQ